MQSTNWNELLANAGNFEPVPAGDYDVIVSSAENTKTQNSKLMFKVRFQVQGGPHNGRTVYSNFVVSPESAGALGYFFQHMAALGLDRSFFAANPPPEQVAAALVNRPCRITVAIGEYRGAPTNEVKAVKPAAAGLPAAMPAPAAGVPAMPQPMAPAMPAPVAQPQPMAPQPMAPPVAQPMAPAPQPVDPMAPVPMAPQPQPQYADTPVVAQPAEAQVIPMPQPQPQPQPVAQEAVAPPMPAPQPAPAQQPPMVDPNQAAAPAPPAPPF